MSGGLAELGEVEGFEEGGGERDVCARGAGEAEKRPNELEAEREVLGRWDQAHGADADLDDRVNEGSEGRLLAEFGLDKAVAVLREDTGPEVKTVDVLPVVDRLVAFLGSVCDAAPEVHCELADEAEACCVGYVLIDTPEFRGRVLHEVDAGECVHGGVSAALDNTLIRGFKDSFLEACIANDHQATEEEEADNSGGFGGGCISPDADDGFDEDL